MASVINWTWVFLAFLLGFVSPVSASPWDKAAIALPYVWLWLSGVVIFLSCVAGLPSFLGWLWLWMKVFWSAKARLEVARRKWDKSTGQYLGNVEKALVAVENAATTGSWLRGWTAERLRQQRNALAQDLVSCPCGPISRMELFPWFRSLIGLLFWILKPLGQKMKKLWALMRSISGETGNGPLQGSWLETVVRWSTSWRAQHWRSPAAREEYNLGSAPVIPQTDGPGDYSPPRGKSGKVKSRGAKKGRKAKKQ